MNTTSKASNAFEAFFGVRELPPPRILSSLKARKLHWRNPIANIGIDIIGIRFHSNVMASTTQTGGSQKHAAPTRSRAICLCLSSPPPLYREVAVADDSYTLYTNDAQNHYCSYYNEYCRRRCPVSSRLDSSMMM